MEIKALLRNHRNFHLISVCRVRTMSGAFTSQKPSSVPPRCRKSKYFSLWAPLSVHSTELKPCSMCTHPPPPSVSSHLSVSFLLNPSLLLIVLLTRSLSLAFVSVQLFHVDIIVFNHNAIAWKYNLINPFTPNIEQIHQRFCHIFTCCCGIFGAFQLSNTLHQDNRYIPNVKICIICIQSTCKY